LRNRVSLEADGGLRTGRDVAVAALLGAEEFGFSTAPLISIGCIMMRKCHLNTCPVGIATQDPELREKFEGTPEQIINYFYFVAQEVRQIMARLGCRTLDEVVGRTDRLRPFPEAAARGLTLAPLLRRPSPPPVLRSFAEVTEQDHALGDALDHDLIARAKPVLSAETRDDAKPLTLDVSITNRNRTVGTMLSRAVVDRFGGDGLPPGTLTLRCDGTAGQSFAAFAAPGITFDVRGAANDYLGKGLSGANIWIRPHEHAGYAPEDSTVIGNVALYGATSGRLFVRGQAGERFAVRNSGAVAVVEGVGDHGCEYMTGGCVVVLGPTGSNFAAGMSGGVAYVYDPRGNFETRCNREMVELAPVDPRSDDATRIRALLTAHADATESTVASALLDRGAAALSDFVRVLPLPFKEAVREGTAKMPEFA
jgi:glutamate synthase domain-containing protein 3